MEVPNPFLDLQMSDLSVKRRALIVNGAAHREELLAGTTAA